MGTTLTFMCWNPCQLYFGHVGDSRAYRLRGHELIQLTRDHTWVNMQVRAGVLSQQEAEHARMRHVLVKSLGTQPGIEPDIVPVEVDSGDRFLLCSDGLNRTAEDHELAEVLRHPDPYEVVRSLVHLGLTRGAPDNITAVLLLNGEGR